MVGATVVEEEGDDDDDEEDDGEAKEGTEKVSGDKEEKGRGNELSHLRHGGDGGDDEEEEAMSPARRRATARDLGGMLSGLDREGESGGGLASPIGIADAVGDGLNDLAGDSGSAGGTRGAVGVGLDLDDD